MTNALAKLNTDMQLTDLEEMILSESGQDELAYDVQPTIVKVAPGGIGQFDMGGDTAKSFKAIVALSQKIRTYYSTPDLDTPPACSSPDGIRGYWHAGTDGSRFDGAMQLATPHPAVRIINEGSGDLPESFDCAKCPLSQWGSDPKNGVGKMCGEKRRLLLLIDGWTLPARFDLPPTSIKAWDKYCSALAARKSAFWAVWTEFTLDSAKSIGGQKYNVAHFESAGTLGDKAQLAAVIDIRNQYRDYISAVPTEAVDPEPIDGGSAEPEEELNPF